MNEHQIKMARHALGLDNPDAKGRSYRNRYVANIHGTVFDDWESMVTNGYAEKGDIRNGMRGYCLTDKGARAVLRPGESLDPEDFPQI